MFYMNIYVHLLICDPEINQLNENTNSLASTMFIVIFVERTQGNINHDAPSLSLRDVWFSGGLMISCSV